MNLHEIVINPEAFIWQYLRGGNGHYISLTNGHPTRHIWRVRRQEPPPLGTRQRAWWSPWNRSGLDPRQPLCGDIKSKSRWPDFAYWHAWGGVECPACKDAIGRATVVDDIAQLNNEDPWTVEIRRNGWRNDPANELDPVTGL